MNRVFDESIKPLQIASSNPTEGNFLTEGIVSWESL